MKVGVNTSPFCKLLHWSLEETSTFVSGIGYEFVDLSGKYHYSSQKKFKEKTSEIRSLLKKYNLKAVAVNYHVNHLDPDPKIRKELSQNFRYLIEAASDLNIPTAVTVSGSPAPFSELHPFFEPNVEGIENAWRDFQEVMGEHVDFASAHNVKIAVEIHLPNLVFNTESVQKMFEVIPSRSLGVTLDPSHLVYQYIDFEMLIKKIGNRIIYVHANDAELFWNKVRDLGFFVTGHNVFWRFRVPGYGDTNWSKLIGTLKLVGYDNVLTYEHHDETVEIKDGSRMAFKFLNAII